MLLVACLASSWGERSALHPAGLESSPHSLGMGWIPGLLFSHLPRICCIHSLWLLPFPNPCWLWQRPRGFGVRCLISPSVSPGCPFLGSCSSIEQLWGASLFKSGGSTAGTGLFPELPKERKFRRPGREEKAPCKVQGLCQGLCQEHTKNLSFSAGMFLSRQLPVVPGHLCSLFRKCWLESQDLEPSELAQKLQMRACS